MFWSKRNKCKGVYKLPYPDGFGLNSTVHNAYLVARHLHRSHEEVTHWIRDVVEETMTNANEMYLREQAGHPT